MKTKIIALLIIFFFTLLLRLWNLNVVGRTWDEGNYVEMGTIYIDLIKKGDFTNEFWYKFNVSVPLAYYTYGFAGTFDIIHITEDGKKIFDYNFSHARLVSVLLSSVTVVLITLIGWVFLSPFIGITAGVVLAMLPFYLGFSQLATLESFIMFFFTATIGSFMYYLHKQNRVWMIITGILLGLALLSKYTNILLIPLVLWIYLIYSAQTKKIFSLRNYFVIVCIGFFVVLLLWPIPWFHLGDVWRDIYDIRFERTKYSIPEVFFGRLMYVPKAYYFVMFLITTPVLILAFFFVGMIKVIGIKQFKKSLSLLRISFFKKNVKKFLSKNNLFHEVKKFFFLEKLVALKNNKNQWIYYAIIAWFCFPFIQSLHNFRQHGIRYIIEIYAPLVLISAIGFDAILERFTKSDKKKLFLLIPVIVYLFITILKISPYYIDYFNGIVGGTRGVAEKQLFQLGWWGEGLRETSSHLSQTAPKGSSIGFAIIPYEIRKPYLENYKLSEYSPSESYDYVVVSYFKVVRDQWRFQDATIRSKYQLVHTVYADGAPLVHIYKAKD